MKSMEAAFFDLDKTVIDRASIAAFGRPFLKGGLINRRVVARAAMSQLIYLYFGADEDRLVVPRGDTTLQSGDEVLVLVTADAEDAVHALFIAEQKA